jgi:hypothetical protein
MPVQTFQAVPVEKMRQYQEYEAYYKEQHKEPGGSVEPERLTITYEDMGNKQPELTDEFREVEDMFKNRYQGGARAILAIIRRAGGKMDRYQRMIYPNGQIGSSLFELVRYALIPARSRKAQPIDFAQFARFLRDQNAPSYIMAKLGPIEEQMLPANGDVSWLRYPH